MSHIHYGTPYDLSLLIVDDNPVIREMLLSLVEEVFERIDTATCGQDALTMLKKHDYDLVITDIHMKNIDSVEFVREAHKIEEHLPILVVSSDIESQHLISLINEEIAGFIARPFNERKMLSQIHRICTAINDRKLVLKYQDLLEGHTLELDRLNKELLRAMSVVNLKTSFQAHTANKLSSTLDDKKVQDLGDSGDYFIELDPLDLEELYDLNHAIEYHAFKIFVSFEETKFLEIVNRLSSIGLRLARYKCFKNLSDGIGTFSQVLANNVSLSSDKHELVSNLFGSFSSTFALYLDNVWKKRSTNPNYYDASLLGDIMMFEDLLVGSHNEIIEDIDFF